MWVGVGVSVGVGVGVGLPWWLAGPAVSVQALSMSQTEVIPALPCSQTARTDAMEDHCSTPIARPACTPAVPQARTDARETSSPRCCALQLTLTSMSSRDTCGTYVSSSTCGAHAAPGRVG